MPSVQIWETLLYGDGRWVCCPPFSSDGSSGTSIVAYSEDGINFTQYDTGLPSDTYCRGGCYGGGYFVLLSKYFSNMNKGLRGRIYYSNTGTSFTTYKINSSVDLKSIAYGNGRFVLVCEDCRIYRSKTSNPSDGWTSIKSPFDGEVSCVNICYGDGKFLITAKLSSTYYQAVSYDSCETFNVYPVTYPAAYNIYGHRGSAYGNGKFVSEKGYTFGDCSINYQTKRVATHYSLDYGNGMFVTSFDSIGQYSISRTTDDY